MVALAVRSSVAFPAPAGARGNASARASRSVDRPTVSSAPRAEALSGSTAARATSEVSAHAGRRVVLTREEGKNGDMMRRLTARGVECLEMPLIETTPGADRDALPDAVRDPAGWAWVCVTSPEAAKVFLDGWRAAGEPSVRVAVVGGGTAKALAPDVVPAFMPSKANAETLVKELPLGAEGAGSDASSAEPAPRVLYPASAKAATTLQDGLASRGAEVTRLNTYSTEKVTSVSEETLALALAADVVTFGSPSAVKAWIQLSGLDPNGDAPHPAYACIGGTSAKACDSVGLPGVLFPESPGLDGWESVVLTALESRGNAEDVA